MENLSVLLLFCLASLLFSSVNGTNKVSLNTTEVSKQAQSGQKDDHVDITINEAHNAPVGKDSSQSDFDFRHKYFKTFNVCDRHVLIDIVRTLTKHRKSLEAILRYCSERNGNLITGKLTSLRTHSRSTRSVSSERTKSKHRQKLYRFGFPSRTSKGPVFYLYNFRAHAVKRQPLDRIDEPDDWRDKVEPKFLRVAEKRQPLDRIDEPDDWRDKVEPKFLRVAEKRQPLDRIDEPDDWRDKVEPRFLRVAEKRQPLDRIDEPDDWRDKVEPKFLRVAEKRQPLDRIDEPDDWRDKVEPKFLSFFEKRQPLDRIDEPDDWRSKVEPKFLRVIPDNRISM